MRELAGDALLRELKNKALCLIYEVDRLAISLPTDARDLLAGFDQPPESRELANDSCVVGHVRGGRDEVRKREEADLASNRFKFALLVEVIGDGKCVDGLTPRVELDRCFVDRPVAQSIEIAWTQDLDDCGHCSRRDQHCA